MPATEIVVTINGVTLNGSTTPGDTCYLLKDTEQLLDGLSTRRSDTEKQGAHGVEPSQSQYRPRELLFRGEIHATTQAERVAMQQDLDTALALPRLQSFDGDDGFRLVEISDEDGVDKQLYAVVVQMPRYGLIETGMPESRTFEFVLFAPDPEIFASDLTSVDGPESYDSTTFVFADNDLPTFKDGDLPTIQDLQGNVLSVTNEGNYYTPLTLTVTGPTTNPVVTNETTGKKIAFTRGGGLTLTADETLTVNTAAYTAVKTSGGVETNVRGNISLDSEWFDLAPGENDLTLFDDTSGELVSQMQASFRSAWI